MTRVGLSVRKGHLHEAAFALLAGLLPFVVAMRAFRLGLHGWSDPLGTGDMLGNYALAKNMAAGNWFLHNPDLGYPGFQDLGHYPVPDLLGVVVIGALAQVAPSAIAAVNLFSVGTFFAVGAVSYLVFRRLGVQTVFALLASWCFSLLPWHFVRAQGHVYLANYISVPLALLVVWALAKGELERNRRVTTFLLLIGAAAIIGINGVYYALMAALLCVVVLLGRVAALGPRSVGWRSLVLAATVPVVTALAISVSSLSVQTPQTGTTVVRNPAESFLVSGGLVTLLYPDPSTFSGSRLARILNMGFPLSYEQVAALSIGGVAAVLLTVWFIAQRWSTTAAIPHESALGKVDFWPGVFVLIAGFFAVGALGAAFSYWVSDSIRSWGRYSVFLSGVAFLVSALALTAWRTSGTSWKATLALAGAWVLAGLSVLDVLAGAPQAPGRAQNALVAAEVRSLVGQIESRLPEECGILQLKIMRFPESPPIGTMADYDPLWPYLYSTDLRWSYAGVKGTPAGEWGAGIEEDPEALKAAAEAASFCGVLLDTASLSAPEELEAYVGTFGDPALRSSSGRWLFFPLPRSGE